MGRKLPFRKFPRGCSEVILVKSKSESQKKVIPFPWLPICYLDRYRRRLSLS
jgi:hypothetical protein